MSTAILHVKEMAQRGLGAPILVMAILAMMVLPLPPTLLDLLFTFNIALSLVVLMVSIYALRPLDFAIFPTILLIVTLMRLAMNIASTRVVLLYGHEGTGAAGKVIEAFGEFVVGGNYAVGLVVFAILVIINFVVVTKGAGRISEVSARFTLDAMPGKQMAIDADLNAGIIDQEQAKIRREEVSQEADFYGSMDGASKFVRGDAVAGILILFINVIGGFAIGMVQHGLPLAEALRNYTLLTIGDGLVAQIPALVLSTAAGIIVTRVNSSADMGGQIMGQLFSNPRVLAVTAIVVGILGMIPGMPNLVFLFFAAVFGAAAWWVNKKNQVKEVEQKREEIQKQQEEATKPQETKELSWEDVPPVDMVGLEVGYGLIPMVDKNQGGELLNRIKGVRKKLSQELGFLIHSVHIRDNLDLRPNQYRLSIMGVPLSESEIYPDREMAINPGQVHGTLQGVAAKDPAFGLDAVWIEPGQRDYAQSLGYTVVDPSTVVATHLSQVIQTNAHQLLGHEEVQKLLDVLAKNSPKLVETLIPNTLPLSVVVKVLQNLLQERVPLRDMRTIVETLAEAGATSQDPGALTMTVRESLGRMIVQNIAGMAEELPVITLEPALEQLLLNTLQGTGDQGGFEPGLAERLHKSLQESAERQEMSGQPSVLLTSPNLRTWLSRLTRHSVHNLHVLSYSEIPDDKQLRVVSSIGQADVS